MRHSSELTHLLLTAALYACGGPLDTPATTYADDPQMLLGRGARGPEVRRTHDYLVRYGYFPNTLLAAEEPNWRPIVAQRPAVLDVFDEYTETALRKLQHNLGLPSTGMLDSRTYASIQEPRCGNADRDPDASARVAKWDLIGPGAKWDKTEITIQFPSVGLAPYNATASRSFIFSGFARWSAVTGLSFRTVSSGADIVIKYAEICPTNGDICPTQPGPLAVAHDRSRGGQPTITFDTRVQWNDTKLYNTAIHEAGHMIGLEHSSLGGPSFGFPIMYPTAQDTTTLSDDDNVAANVLYDDWEQLPGLAIDIASGNRTGFSTVWILGTDHVAYRWTGSSWSRVNGVTGTKLDVDQNGMAWVVQDGSLAGRVARYTGTGTNWVSVPGGGLLVDIGIDWQGNVYGIGNAPFQTFAFNGSGWTFKGGPANQVAIDVASNSPTVVTSSGEIWTMNGNGGWTRDNTGLGMDVGIGGNGEPGAGNLGGNLFHTWLIGTDESIWVKNRQDLLVNELGVTKALAEDRWVSSGGFARRITVGPRGRPWVIDSGGRIYRRRRLP